MISDPQIVDKGFPQGSILAPPAVNSVPKYNFFSHLNIAISIFMLTIPSCVPPDTFLFHLQHVLNYRKTKCLHTTRAERFDVIQIDTLKLYEYLGIWLDRRLSYKTHFERLAQKLKLQIKFF